MPELIIIRGLPGSGKSTLAKQFEDLGYSHIETDQFFCQSGEYIFDATKLQEAHEWCFNRVKNLLDGGENVCVSNTFSRIWEMQPYLDLSCHKTVISCEGNYGNTHGVPDSVINNMRKRWEAYN